MDLKLNRQHEAVNKLPQSIKDPEEISVLSSHLQV